MTKGEFENLREGDVITSATGEDFVIHGIINSGKPSKRFYIGVMVQFISAPKAWTLSKRMGDKYV